jgi:DNA-binding CsgD family transcriptional regulator
VIAVLRRTAARALVQGDAARAVELLERARQEPCSQEERAHVLLELGRAEAISGSPDALGRLTDAIERLPGADERARAALDVGRTLLALGRLSDAAATFELGVRDAADGSDLGGLLRAGRATVLRMLRGRAGVVAEPRIAPADGRTATDRALLAELAIDAALRGDPRERTLELATGALARGALLDDDSADGIAYYLAAAALTISEHLQMADAALAAAVDDARSRGSALGLATASHFSAYAIMRRGRVPAAAAAARDALDGRRHGWGLAVSSARALLAECLIEGGDLRAAEQQIELAGELGEDDAVSRLSHLAGRGRLHLLGNRPDEALADFMACGGILAAAGAPNPSVLPWRSGAARALWVVGDHYEARLLADEELALAREFGAPGPIGRALRTVAGMEEGMRAIDPLEEAVACLEDAPTALERARALVELGSALRRVRRPRDAREPLRRGLDLAQRCGAAELAARAMREVTAAGARPRRTALHGLEALTPRELQTAGLAAEGMSNREIAAALYVTLKTVEWHLKHTYGKLGISSRAELARALARPVAPPEDPD